jgi:hypothetical protein
MKNFTLFLIFLFGLQNLNAQMSITHPPAVDITNSNVFLDASKIFSSAAGAENNIGKGIVIPSVDLINFEFIIEFVGSTESPSFYDGMLVYNSETGNTLITGDRSSTATAVTPGFYYFSNPNGALNENITGGIWTPLGSGSVKNYTTTPIKTAISINDEQVWAVKGSFVATGTSALVSVIMPALMSGYYKMTTYLSGKTFRSDISEFKMTTTVLNTDNVVTGNGLFSEVYPAGTYDYTLEYFQ